MEALRAQAAVFGPVASDTTVLRALGEIGDRRRAAIATARAAARAHLWAQLPDGLPESRFAGGVCQPGMIVRRTKLAPGEQPTLFHADGYKYSAFVTTTGTLTVQLLDARHRVHARVEDQVRTGKDTGLGHLPSKSWQVNNAWCQAVAIACDLLAWFKLVGCTGQLATAEPKTLRYRLLQVPARLTRGARYRWLRLPRDWPWSTVLAQAIAAIGRIPLPAPQPD